MVDAINDIRENNIRVLILGGGFGQEYLILKKELIVLIYLKLLLLVELKMYFLTLKIQMQ